MMMKNVFLLSLVMIRSLPGVSSEQQQQQQQQQQNDMMMVYNPGHQFQACSFTSTIRFKTVLQSSGFENSIYESFNEQRCPNIAAPISQISKCISSFKLDPSNVIQHLQSTIDILNNYYVFKSIAANPLKSYPLKTPFDFPIYNGIEQGQFDIISGLEELLQEVKDNNRATLDIFLRMNAMTAKLFDGHLLINNDISTGGMLANRTLFVFSGEVLDGSAKGTMLRTEFPTANEEFVLIADIISKNKNNNEMVKTSKEIKKIDGKDPLEFFIEIASKPSGIVKYKSLGARVQGMIQLFTNPNSVDYNHHSITHVKLRENYPDTSKFFKDEYHILYEDGSSTVWKLVQDVPQAVSCDMTKTMIENTLLDKPGSMYQHLDSMKHAVMKSESIIQKLKKKIEEKKKKEENDNPPLLPAVERMPHHSSHKKRPSFIGFIRFGKSIGYKVYDDYAVLKIDSFSGWKKTGLLKAWAYLTQEAHDRDVTNLIIDVTDNGGGFVKLGYFLAQLLYPDATWEEISNPYDRLYSPSLEDDIGDIKSIVDDYYDLLHDNITLAEQITDTLNANRELLIKKMSSMLSLLEAMMDILSGKKYKIKPEEIIYLEGSIVSTIKLTKDIRQSIVAKPNFLSTEQFETLWRQLVATANEVFSFPFADLNFKSLFGMEIENTEVSERVEHFRGGTFDNYTSVFHLVDPFEFTSKQWLKEKYIHHPFQFDQYIILGSGSHCGSTTDTFRHTVQAYAYTKNGKNSAAVVPPVYTVSFGGTGEKLDAAVTQFPAGTSGEAGNVEELYLIALILRVLNTILPPLIGGASSLNSFDKFYNDLPNVCYYCNEAFKMPIYQIYSRLTGPSGIPMEYVNEIPDYYIRQWPRATTFGSDKDLPDLYKLTSRVFYDRETIE